MKIKKCCASRARHYCWRASFGRLLPTTALYHGFPLIITNSSCTLSFDKREVRWDLSGFQHTEGLGGMKWLMSWQKKLQIVFYFTLVSIGGFDLQGEVFQMNWGGQQYAFEASKLPQKSHKKKFRHIALKQAWVSHTHFHLINKVKQQTTQLECVRENRQRTRDMRHETHA